MPSTCLFKSSTSGVPSNHHVSRVQLHPRPAFCFNRNVATESRFAYSFTVTSRREASVVNNRPNRSVIDVRCTMS